MEKRKFVRPASLYGTGLLLLAAVYLIYHLFTLQLSPLPWFDEVVYADITDSYIHNQFFDLKLSPVFSQGEVLCYGPVYFYLQSLICKLAGLDAFQFRLLNFVSGLLVVLTAALLLKRVKPGKPWIVFFVVALSTETLYNQVLHSGRMDLVAMLFILLSYYNYFLFRDTGKNRQLLLATFFLSVALLTTPRVLFACTFYAVDFIWLAFRYKSLRVLRPYLLMGLATGLVYTCWVYMAYGNYKNYFHSLTELNDYIGNPSLFSSIVRYKYHINLWICLLVLLPVYLLNRTAFNTTEKQTLLLCLANIAGFHLLVREAGPYTAMVMPFYLLFISIVLARCAVRFRYLKVLAYLVLIPNLLLFVLKGMIVLRTSDERSGDRVEKMISAAIPRGSRVVANFQYFYALKNNGCSFECIELGDNIQNRFRHQSQVFNFDYLIMNDNYVNAASVYYLRNASYQRINLHTGYDVDYRNGLFALIKKAGFIEPAGYNGVIYKRIR